MNQEGSNYAGKTLVSGITMFASAGTSWIDELERLMRIGASAMALISGGVMLWFFIKDRKQKKRNKKYYEENHQKH